MECYTPFKSNDMGGFMATMALFNYMDSLRRAGFTEQQSEGQARALEEVLSSLRQEVKQEFKQEINYNDLSTKGDVRLVKDDIARLELAIEKVRYDALKFTVWTGVIVIFTLGGMLAKGFHWL